MNLQSYTKGDSMSSYCMHLFGSPYQFTDRVDPRVKGISSDIGVNYMKNILLEAPICTIIPGLPSFLPGKTDDEKVATGATLIEASQSEGMPFQNLKEIMGGKTLRDDQMRLYDFKPDYVSYMNYVNVLCRTAAGFLNLQDTITMNDGTECSFMNFNWMNYRLNKDVKVNITDKVSYTLTSIVDNIKDKVTGKDKKKKGKKKTATNTESTGTQPSAMQNDPRYTSKTTTSTEDTTTIKEKYKTQKYSPSSLNFIFGDIEEDDSIRHTLEELKTDYGYVQFYVDPNLDSGESFTNETGQSSLNSIFETAESKMKDIAFMASSGGIDPSVYTDNLADAASAITNGIQNFFPGQSTIGGVISRVINLGGDVLKGNNMVIPEIYTRSGVSRNLQLTIHLKTPYGSALGFYMDILVPLFHLLPLVWPKQSTPNTYGAPFLVKCYVEGVFSCNLGMVQSIAISRVGDSFSVNGLPNEIDVTLDIMDLYSAISMSSAKDPALFLANSSLIEYLATNCGLNLVKPNTKYKFASALNAIMNKLTDIPANVNAELGQGYSSFLANSIFGWFAK